MNDRRRSNCTIQAALILLLMLLWTEPSFASLESSLIGLKTKLTGIILPILSVMGLAIASLSLFTGNPNAKQHIMYAICGCLFGFGAEAIVTFISQTIR